MARDAAIRDVNGLESLYSDATAGAPRPIRGGGRRLSRSSSFFRRLVDQGVMPRPRVAGNRRIWDIEELDVAFKALPRDGDDATCAAASGGSWTDYA